MAEKTASRRDNLRPGSFRGAPFVTESHDHTLGRRSVRHEYPKRDVPYAEDMGRLARGFAMELFVIGDDYMAQRDRLREALEKNGPGELVHPYLGTQTVQVDGEVHLRETLREGRMARFSVTFVEAGLEIAPDTKQDTAWGVGKNADAVTEAAKEGFAEKFKITGPARLLTGAKAGIDKVLGGLKDVVGAPLGELKFSQDILASLWGTPSGLAGWLVDQLGSLGSLTPVTSASLASGLAMQTLPMATTTASTTPSVTQTTVQAQNQVNLAAVDNLVQQTAVAEAARASAQATYSSADEALAVRETLCEALEVVSSRASDPVYVRLADLRAAVVLDLGTRAAQLPRLANYQLPATMPALVVAHRIHGDATREADIVARNRVRHPGAVPGGTTLEVLSDARV
ncbi:MAG: DNA circularization protein [Humidesulfovibrio sp.]